MNESQEKHPSRNPNYIGIFFLLGALTIIEVLVSGINGGIRIPVLIVLAAVKAALVAMFYMHLRFDSRIFSAVFVGPLLLAGALVIALMALLGSVHVA